jgi:hypothetical protein
MSVKKRLEGAPQDYPQVEFQTENGYSIFRLAEMDESISAAGTRHCFAVRDPLGHEIEVTVDISERAAAEITRRSEGRLLGNSSYWISCAERHLATYLWENNDCPPGAKLTVDCLTPEDLDLARRWRPMTIDETGLQIAHRRNQ